MQSLNDLLLMAKIKMDGLGYTPMIRGGVTWTFQRLMQNLMKYQQSLTK